MWKHLLASEKGRAVGLLALFNSSSAPAGFLVIKDPFPINEMASSSAERITFWRRETVMSGQKCTNGMVKSSICCSFSWKRSLLLHLPNPVTVPKSPGIWQGPERQSHLSSIFLLCIYLASENAGNVFAFRLGPFAKPQKYTAQFLIIVWFLTGQSVFKLARNIFFLLEICEKHQQLFVFIFWKLPQEQNKNHFFFLIGSYLIQCVRAGVQLITFGLQLTQHGFLV